VAGEAGHARNCTSQLRCMSCRCWM
jgi:hypothetical protein